MNLVKRYLTKNPCYTANVNKADSRYVTFQTRGPIGLMLHSVGCAQPSAEVFCNMWDKETYDSACVHGFIDANTGTVYQTLPWNYRGWHGGGSSNNTHIGVEMCESQYIRYYKVGEAGYAPAKFTINDRAKAQADCKRAYNAAVELFAMLCKKYNLNPLTDICSHKEGGERGIASGHIDPEHYWTQLGMSYTMDGFRADVKRAMDPPVVNPFEDVSESAWYYDDVMWAVQKGITNGTSATTFSPDNPVTRAQAVALLHRFAKANGLE